MDKKLNFTDLCTFHAKAAGLSTTDAESFVHAFYDTIVEGLEKDGIVKINGLGTFKIVEVESRSSVNINTGERFEIDGHKRLTFIPADSLKDIINAPFAMFEPVEVDDEIDDEEDENESNDISNEVAIVVENPATDEQVATIEEIAAEEPPFEEEKAVTPEEVTIPVMEIEEEMPQEVEKENISSVAVVEIDEEMPFEQSDYTQEDIQTETIEEEPKRQDESLLNEVEAVETNIEDAVVAVPESENNTEGTEDNINNPTKEESAAKETVTPIKEEEIFFNTLPRNKKRNNYLKLSILFLFIIICAAGAFVGLHFYNKNIISTDKIAVVKDDVKGPKEKIVENIVPQETDTTIVANDSTANITTDTITPKEVVIQEDTIKEVPEQQIEVPAIKATDNFKIVDALAVRELSTIFVADTTDYKITGTICTHKVKSEETLIKISHKYYGDKRLWPYIVKHNNMLRPNDLACDMLLKIPLLTPKK